MKIGDQFILLKYTNGIYDCIEQHLEVINELGYCWFGKIGVVPSESNIRQKMKTNNLNVILYCRGEAYSCKLLDVSVTRPKDGCPLYYEDYFYKKGIYPKMYFKISSIKQMDSPTLSKFVISKSRKPMIDSITKSMASFFYVEYIGKEPDIVDKINKQKQVKKYQKREKLTDKKTVAPNSCIYRLNGKCTNKHCISYKYECNRPNDCISQKCTTN